MKMKLMVAAACSLAMIAPASTAFAVPSGNAYGYWAGRLCDHVGPTTHGTTYWQDRGYKNRGQCITAEGQSLARGEWDPETLDPVAYPI